MLMAHAMFPTNGQTWVRVAGSCLTFTRLAALTSSSWLPEYLFTRPLSSLKLILPSMTRVPNHSGRERGSFVSVPLNIPYPISTQKVRDENCYSEERLCSGLCMRGTERSRSNADRERHRHPARARVRW